CRPQGAAIAKELASQGCDVLVNYNSDRKGAEEVKKFIEEETKHRAIIFKADVSRYSEIKAMIEKAAESFTRIDILINNAGIAIWAPVFEITEEIWDKTLDTNLKSVFFTSQLAAHEMIKTGGGIIVNISSLAASGSMDCLIPYVSSKGGMTLLTKGLAIEFAPYNIRVNTIAPGTIDIERNRKTDPCYPDDWIPYIPMGRVGKVEEVAKPVVFLCCEDSSYMTGQNIYVSGGETDYVPMPRSEFARRKK
ncbi:MAG: SDR family oxidoreductase, partial [Actinobacteria bacterium]|nr:SDR family oxidoreductase [Actinomycetota bacterium]